MRIVIAALVAAALVAGGLMLWLSRPAGDTAWRDYKRQFIAADGRVLDIGNGRVSHTEGQGYAMLFAVAANDPATFDSVWTWTRKTLRRPDGLFSWRYIPGAQSTVPDKNNATDGDLVICWALARAATAWGRPADRDAALDLATALHAVIDEDGEDAFLKPGVDGFTGEGKRVVNLSYWVFPALAEIAHLTDDRLWVRVAATGHRLITQARFGEYLLPPDWLETSGELRPAEGFPARFSYDAIRVPLYLIWGGYTSSDDLGKFNGFWARYEAESTPAWVDVVLGHVSEEKQSPGMQAVARLTASLVNGTLLPPRTFDLRRTTDYYSASLLMLTKLAEDARAQR